MKETRGKLEDVWTGMRIEDSRLTVEADDSDATVYVKGMDAKPLSVGEPHAELAISGEDMRADITLDGEQLDALADAIYHVREHYND